MEKTSRTTATHRVMAVTAVSALALSGLSLTGFINPAPAHAVGGEVSESTGVLWGVDEGDGLGSYQVGIGEDDPVTGFIIGDASEFPTSEDTYSEPEELDDLTEQQRGQLAVALWVNHQVSIAEDDKVSDVLTDIATTVMDSEADIDIEGLGLDDLTTLSSFDRDDITATVASVIRATFDDDFDEDTIPDNIRTAHDLVLSLSGSVEDNEDNIFAVRSVDNENKPDIISPVDVDVSAPVIGGVTLPGSELSEDTTEENDPDEPEQTITTPTTRPQETSVTTTEEEPEDIEIRTSAGTQARNIVEEGATIVDTVTFTGLNPEEEYRLVGETYYKDENGQAVSDGNTGETVFTPDTPNGRIDVSIPLENVESRELVVFESLYDSEGEMIAEHKDIDDRAQTVGAVPVDPNLRTSVQVDDGIDPTRIQSDMTVTDLVAYSNLVPGQNYRLEARLACKHTGDVYEENNGEKEAVTTHEFTPEESSGETAVEGIEVTDPDCDTQVVYQKLYELTGNGEEGLLIGTHEDIDDMAQTFGKDSTSTSLSGGDGAGEELNEGDGPGSERGPNYDKQGPTSEAESTPESAPETGSVSTPAPPQQSQSPARSVTPEKMECIPLPVDENGQTISDPEQPGNSEYQAAVNQARSYREYTDSSNAEIEYMLVEYSGFTPEQAEYAVANIDNTSVGASAVNGDVTHMAQAQSVAPEDSVRFEDYNEDPNQNLEYCEEPAPRQTIDNVPSGASSVIGFTLFTR